MDLNDEQPFDYLERISVDPRVLVGKPVIKGTRMPVSKILNLVAHGQSFEEIIDDYPGITEEDIKAALLYAGARLDHEDVITLSALP